MVLLGMMDPHSALHSKSYLSPGVTKCAFSLAIALGLSNHPGNHPGATITVSDIPPMLPLLTENVALNPSRIPVGSIPLSWGEPLPECLLLKPPTIVLAADCCYYEPAFPLLLNTLDDLLSQTSAACCYFCFKKRRKADMSFVKMARKRFDVREGAVNDPKRVVWQREGIFWCVNSNYNHWLGCPCRPVADTALT